MILPVFRCGGGGEQLIDLRLVIVRDGETVLIFLVLIFIVIGRVGVAGH
jgi:hypothetical protein